MLRLNSEHEQAASARVSAGAKLACLDGLRGVAILLVVLFHLPLAGDKDLTAATLRFWAPFRFGFSGVHLFLVLSGFLPDTFADRKNAGRAGADTQVVI